MKKKCPLKMWPKNCGNINVKTVQRAKKVAITELASLIFGIDGVKI